jgi:hypothetical protein
MTINFDKILSEEERQRIIRSRERMQAYYKMPDRFLARDLLRLSRSAKKEMLTFCDISIRNTLYGSYNNYFLQSVIPELARRLGETQFELDEKNAADPLLINATDEEFRRNAANVLRHQDLGFKYGHKTDEINSCYLLSCEPCNGNPVAIALDRIYPANELSEDWIAKMILEVGRSRFDRNDISMWSPEFQEYKS